MFILHCDLSKGVQKNMLKAWKSTKNKLYYRYLIIRAANCLLNFRCFNYQTSLVMNIK